jgi:hypothetical protein
MDKSKKIRVNVLKNILMLLSFGLFLGSVSSCCNKNKINSTEALMKEISSRYYGKWFTQIKFSQTADYYENDTLVKSEINDEEYRYPSNLLIYLTPGDTTNRYICRNDSVLIYENNELISAKHITHDAVILGMDIFNMTYEDIMKRWGDLPYDIDKFHESVYNGRKIYVIGAVKGDTLSNQVWFDAEHLYLVKMIKNRENGLQEVTLLNYIQLENKGWIEQEMEFKRNGKIYMKEKYFNITVPD